MPARNGQRPRLVKERIAAVRLIVDCEALFSNVLDLYYQVHIDTAQELGWSTLDRHAFRRTFRAKGRNGDFLPGARDAKRKRYDARFDERIEADELIQQYEPHEDVTSLLAALAAHGTCLLVTLGGNVDTRRNVIARAGLDRWLERMESLNRDPRRRAGELTMLAAGDPRTLVVSCSDALIRAAGQATLFTVGISTGTCTADRLHQAGSDVVVLDLAELVASLEAGATDLIRAGLLPPPLG